MPSVSDIAGDALRSCLAGDVAEALSILSEHVRHAADPQQAMFVLAVGYAAVAHDDELASVDGLSPDDADLVRTLVTAVRADDLVGGWLLWRMASAGSAGAALGGLLAVAALSARRDAGL